MVVGKKAGMIKVKVRTTEKGEKGRGLEDWVGQREVGDLLYLLLNDRLAFEWHLPKVDKVNSTSLYKSKSIWHQDWTLMASYELGRTRNNLVDLVNLQIVSQPIFKLFSQRHLVRFPILLKHC